MDVAAVVGGASGIAAAFGDLANSDSDGSTAVISSAIRQNRQGARCAAEDSLRLGFCGPSDMTLMVEVECLWWPEA